MLSAAFLCAALVLPAQASAISSAAEQSALAQTQAAVTAQSTTIKKNFVGMTEIFATNWSSLTKTISADLTGDNKNDKIKIKSTVNSYGYVKKLTVKVKGKTALTLKFDTYDTLNVSVDYVRQSKNREFLYIYGYGEDDYTTVCRIYTYNKKTGKLKCVLKADNSVKPLAMAQLTSVTKKKITVYYSAQPLVTGYINWSYSYVYKNGKFKATSKSSSTVKCGCASISDTAYRSYLENNQYVTQKKLKLYKTAGSKKVAATIKADKVVTLKKICVKNGKIWLKFSCGKKSGWIKVNTIKENYTDAEYQKYYKNNTNWFYGIGYAG